MGARGARRICLIMHEVIDLHVDAMLQYLFHQPSNHLVFLDIQLGQHFLLKHHDNMFARCSLRVCVCVLLCRVLVIVRHAPTNSLFVILMDQN
jgi:hypothetical protein